MSKLETNTIDTVSGTTNLVIGSTSGDNGMTIVSQSGNYNGTIRFSDGANSGDDAIRGVIQYYHGQDYMRFYTNATERLRLNSVGSALFANGIQIGVDEGSSSSGGLLIHRYSSTSIDDGTDFDVTITWPHSNTGAFMVECFSGHSHYRGSISYYKVVGMYGASSASTGGVDMTAVQETNTNTISFSDTSNATQRGNGSDYSITITGRSGESNVGTSIDSHVHVYVHSRVTPTSVTIS